VLSFLFLIPKAIESRLVAGPNAIGFGWALGLAGQLDPIALSLAAEPDPTALGRKHKKYNALP
jgi:hypothetical protein